MSQPPDLAPKAGVSIWWFAFGYFACYAPYSALTKAVTGGLTTGMQSPLTGFELLPCTVLVSTIGMYIFLSAMRWWRHASHFEFLGRSLPRPGLWTFLSGVCTAGIIGTTTLAYTFEGVSIVFVMLLMRGGVVLIAPVVDRLSGRRVRWFSAIGSVLSLAALVVAFSEQGGYDISVLCAVDVGIYLLSYFIRFRFMSRLAKSDDASLNQRYFVEEQMVASPFLLVVLLLAAFLGHGGFFDELHAGFTSFWSRGVVLQAVLIGALSQGTGIFGSLILLDARENTFCVPVNRSSSILAGVVASFTLALIFDISSPSAHQLVGASLIIAAILVLSIAPALERRSQRQAAAAVSDCG